MVGASEEKTVCVLCREAMPEAPAEAPAPVTQEEEEEEEGKMEEEVPMELGRCCRKVESVWIFMQEFAA